MLSTKEKINPHQEIPPWNFRILRTKNEDIGCRKQWIHPQRKKTKRIPRIRVRGDPKIMCTPGKEGNTVQIGVSQKVLR